MKTTLEVHTYQDISDTQKAADKLESSLVLLTIFDSVITLPCFYLPIQSTCIFSIRIYVYCLKGHHFCLVLEQIA